MLDIKFIRDNAEAVRQNIRNKFQDAKLPLVDEVIALDTRRTAPSSRRWKSSVRRATDCPNRSDS